jgi:hypothetical protein
MEKSMNEDQKIMYQNKIHEVKVLIRDEFTLDVLLEIKEILDDAIANKGEL